jgi:hypothetical protein
MTPPHSPGVLKISVLDGNKQRNARFAGAAGPISRA